MRRRPARATAGCVLTLALAAPATAGIPPLPVLGDGTTTRVSTRADGGQAAGGHVAEPSVSANGRYVVFYTSLELGLGTCGPGTYLRDLVTMRLEMISVPAGGCTSTALGGVGSAHSYTSVSADGRYVAFTSYARDLLPGRLLPENSPTGINTLHVYVRDRLRRRTVLVSVGYDGKPANSSAFAPTVSDDGRFVAFESSATNLVRGDRGDPDDPFRTDVWLRDLHRGTTERVGPNIRRTERSSKHWAALSGNGRYVAFDADSGMLAPSRGTGPGYDEPAGQVYVWDRVTKKTEMVSRNDAGYASDGTSTIGGYVGSKISRDGRWIIYRSDALNLTMPEVPLLRDNDQIFLYDRVMRKVHRVTDGLAGEGGNGQSDHPCISADGRYVSFASASSNLGDVDATPGYYEGLPDVGTDIYLWDRDTKRTRLVSRSTEGLPANANSRESCPANGGKVVVFTSSASTLVAGDTNLLADLFLRRYPS